MNLTRKHLRKNCKACFELNLKHLERSEINEKSRTKNFGRIDGITTK